MESDGRSSLQHQLSLFILLLLSVIILAGCTGGSTPSTIAWITGLVTKSRGEPIPGTTVTLEQTGQQATADNTGQFQIGTTYRGNATLRADASNYLTLRWPASITDAGISNLRLRLVTMSDYDAALFQALTGASNNSGTWRWDVPTVAYYVDHSGPYQPQFDSALSEAFTQWSMLTQRKVSFVESNSSAPLQIRYVSSSPCGFGGNVVGCAGVTSVTANGEVRGAIIELRADYGTDVGLATHEVGHTLAFTGHSPNQTDIMYLYLNGETSPSNAEAAVVSVLYGNPPGTTMPNIHLPSAQMAGPAAPPAPVAAMTPAGTTAAAAAPEPMQIPPVLSALGSIGEMVRSWFASLGCLLGLPGPCQPGLLPLPW